MDATILSTKLVPALLLMFIIPNTFSAEPPLPDGRRFRQIVADKYPTGNVYIGGTTGWRKRPGGSGVTMDREFSYVTPENDFKQSKIHPRPDVWNWKEADAWVEHYQKQESSPTPPWTNWTTVLGLGQKRQSDSRRTEAEPSRVYDRFVPTL